MERWITEVSQGTSDMASSSSAAQWIHRSCSSATHPYHNIGPLPSAVPRGKVALTIILILRPGELTFSLSLGAAPSVYALMLLHTMQRNLSAFQVAVWSVWKKKGNSHRCRCT